LYLVKRLQGVVFLLNGPVGLHILPPSLSYCLIVPSGSLLRNAGEPVLWGLQGMKDFSRLQ